MSWRVRFNAREIVVFMNDNGMAQYKTSKGYDCAALMESIDLELPL